MYEGFFLGIALLVMVWVVYATWKPARTLAMSMILTALAWTPSMLYASKQFHYAGYIMLPALVFWFVAEKLKEQRGAKVYAPTK